MGSNLAYEFAFLFKDCLLGFTHAKISQVWRHETYYGGIEKAVKAEDYKLALRMIRSVIIVMKYLNHPNINPKLIRSANDVRVELNRADTEWAGMGNEFENVQDFWDEWIRDLLHSTSDKAHQWVQDWTKKMGNHWGVRTGDEAKQVMEALETFRQEAMVLNQDGLD